MASHSLSSQERDWAWLPENLIFIILSKLFLLSDLNSFGSVCTRWQSLVRDRLLELNIHPRMSFNRNLPMLLIPSDDNDESTRNLFSIHDGDLYDLRFKMPCNTSKGTIQLPPFLAARDTKELVEDRDFFPEYYIAKAVFSANPLSCPEFVVMVIYGEDRKLAFWKSGDQSWTYVLENHHFYDIIYCCGHFLAVNFWGEVYYCDVDPNKSLRLSVVSEPVVGPLSHYTRRYIVETADGDTILQAVRLVHSSMNSQGDAYFETLGFMVYKLMAVGGILEWVPLMSINDGALFLGDSHSYHVKASDFPGIMPNSIYFTDDYQDIYNMYHKPYQIGGTSDIGAFQVGQAVFYGHYTPNLTQKHLPPPIWILPTI